MRVRSGLADTRKPSEARLKLDPELLRALLRQVEGRRPNHVGGDPDLVGWDQDEVFDHIEALHDAGLVVAHIMPNNMGGKRIYAAYIEKLTPAGRAFIANANNDTIWAH
jgi:hypothetical protein